MPKFILKLAKWWIQAEYKYAIYKHCIKERTFEYEILM